MCGRYVLFTPGEELARVFDVVRFIRLQPRYNIAPTQEAPIIRIAGDGAREMTPLRWGLIPSSAKTIDDGPRPINARSESIRSRPIFRDPFRRRRCLVPADGFYEWRKIGPPGPDQVRQPMFIRLDGGRPFAMAGLWERWQPPQMPDVPTVETFAILTTNAAAKIRDLHERMPVLLDPAAASAWLDERTPEEDLLALCRPVEDERVDLHPVDRRVNRPEVEGPACIEPAEEEEPRQPTLF